MGKGNQNHSSRRTESRDAEYLDNRAANVQQAVDLLDRIGRSRRRSVWRAQRGMDGRAEELQDAADSGWGMMPRVAKEYHVSGILGGASAEETPDSRGLPRGDSDFEEFDGVAFF